MSWKWRIGILAFIFANVTDAADASFCSALAGVRADASANFASLKGAVKSDSQWFTTISLPNLTNCYLSSLDGKLVNYVCESLARADQQTAENEMWKLADKIEACPKGNLRVLGQRGGTNTMLFDDSGGAPVAMLATSTMDPNVRPLVIKWVVQLSVLSNVPSDKGVSDADKDAPYEAPVKKELASAASFCPILLTVVTSAESSFSSIIGKGAASSGWDTDTKLPSLTHCLVRAVSDKQRYYTCEVSEQPDQAASNSDLDSLRDLVRSCLDDKWDLESSRPSVNKEREELFWRGDHSPTVRARQTHYVGPWSLQLNVDMARDP